MIIVKRFLFNPFGENTYILTDEDTKDCIVVDPGMMSQNEKNEFDAYIKQNGLNLTKIVNTHMHIDHCIGNTYLKKKYNVPIAANMLDTFLGERVQEQASMFKLDLEEDGCSSNYIMSIDEDLSEGSKLKIGNSTLEILHVPGHSPGGIALYNPNQGFVLTGDTLFRMGIGRTDLPGGDYDSLVKSILRKLFKLPANTIVYPGHGPETTIGAETGLS